jgi:hypothetical protein
MVGESASKAAAMLAKQVSPPIFGSCTGLSTAPSGGSTMKVAS